MFTPVFTRQFKRDLKKIKKDTQKDFNDLKEIIRKILASEPLAIKHKDHPLKGNFKGRRECHIYPNWLLIYKMDKNKKEIIFEQTGSHSELFD